MLDPTDGWVYTIVRLLFSIEVKSAWIRRRAKLIIGSRCSRGQVLDEEERYGLF
jgi:hypothetical protein